MAQEQFEKILRILLEKGANINAQTQVPFIFFCFVLFFFVFGIRKIRISNIYFEFFKKKKYLFRRKELLFTLLFSRDMKILSKFSWMKEPMLIVQLRFILYIFIYCIFLK